MQLEPLAKSLTRAKPSTKSRTPDVGEATTGGGLGKAGADAREERSWPETLGCWAHVRAGLPKLTPTSQSSLARRRPCRGISVISECLQRVLPRVCWSQGSMAAGLNRSAAAVGRVQTTTNKREGNQATNQDETLLLSSSSRPPGHVVGNLNNFHIGKRLLLSFWYPFTTTPKVVSSKKKQATHLAPGQQ